MTYEAYRNLSGDSLTLSEALFMPAAADVDLEAELPSRIGLSRDVDLS